MEQNEHPIPLGVTVKDKVTGFTGITTGVAYYLTGCTQYAVVPPIDDKGLIRSTEWFDYQRLELIGDNATIDVTSSDTGGPQRDAPL